MSERNYRQIRTAKANDVGGTIKRTLSYVAKDNKIKIFFIAFNYS